MTLFSHVSMAASDTVTAVGDEFDVDPHPAKINLSAGVYLDDEGQLPQLACVAAAEALLLAAPKPKDYLPIDGTPAFKEAVQTLLFGRDHAFVASGRVTVVQTLGSSGALKVGADLLKRIKQAAVVLVGDPGADHHREVFSGAGFDVRTYPYYNRLSHSVNFDALLDRLQSAPPGSIVVLQACDLTIEQWDQVIAVCRGSGLVPFLDFAYQGLGEGVSEDAVALRRFIDSGLDLLIATSFSHSFSVHGERVGALSVVCRTEDECRRVLSQLKINIRTNYSTPPTFGASLVTAVLNTPVLRSQWELELASMRGRLKRIREALVTKLHAAGVSGDLSYLLRQKGIFGHCGLTTPEIRRMRDESGVYGLANGRVCVSAINNGNIDAVVAALAKVMTH
jgi:aromatic-amino-acid transaminase